MKKIFLILTLIVILTITTSCGEKKILHCDHCNKEVTVDAKSNTEEDWTIFCKECNDELFGDDPILGNK